MTLLNDYVEVIARRSAAAPVFLTCEHASERFPAPFSWSTEDAWLSGTHWAFDLGAAELTRELAAGLGAPAVLSRFSRLLIDPNRYDTAPDLYLKTAEGRSVEMNQDIDAAERGARFAMAEAYHSAIDGILGSDAATLVLSIHSFTPEYEGVRRAVEIGVLFDAEAALAEAVRGAFLRAGFAALLNEPYSGKFGLMYSAERHARRHGRRPLELEVRQDLASDPAVRTRIVAVLREALGELSAGA